MHTADATGGRGIEPDLHTDRSQDVGPGTLTAARWRQRMRNSSAIWLPVITGLLIVALLETIHRFEFVPSVIFPSPFSIASEVVAQATGPIMWPEASITAQEGLLGFAIGTGLGFLLGVGVGLSAIVSRGLYPYIVLLQAMPRVALAPIFVAILGFGMASKVVVAIAICFFPVMINTIVGLTSADESEIALMRSLCATRWQTFRKLLLPGALPTIFAGLKTSATLAFVGAIVGELTAANAGFGALIEASSFQMRMASVFAYIFWLSLISLALFGLVGLVERKVVFWKENVGLTVARDSDN